MSQNLPPQMEGQESSPNPVELFWETNRRLILTVAGIFVAIVAGYYAMAYTERQKLDREMSLAIVGTNLDKAYANPDFPELDQQALQSISSLMLMKLPEHLAAASDAELEKAISDLDGSPRLAAVLWGAGRAYFEKAVHAEAGAGREAYFAKATETIQRLQKEFPKSEWVVETPYPVQFTPRKPEKDDTPKLPNAKPEYEDPKPGSAAGFLLAQIDKQKAFFAENEHYFTPTYPPEGSPEVVLEFEGFGPVTLALYENAAPTHVHAFLDLVHSGFYDGQRVHEVVRTAPFMAMFRQSPEEVKFGIPSTREDDRTKWTTPRMEDDDLLEFEVTEAAKKLSHFPGVLTAADQGGKASKQRYSLLATDGAAEMDGKRVIVGIATGQASLDVIREISQVGFSTEDEQDQGRGKPGTNITITSAKVTAKGDWEPKAEDPKNDEPKEDDPDKGSGDGGDTSGDGGK